ncbi:hypothetical protein BOTBODRAFT_28596 [Botryobasidium botryosum FD-172 SS1]|uniref:Glutamyl-tRNA(Gln) amidotransferase subunit A, mitochondrial n=1 Tax=Botryobasidium botryosum (strain FD-172 SS1) TaxID=930990 RepID=A0A067MU11_BOTB1|nr:hypothetical protein BOTBODRAFT_28596 [Botryobasidium botryosum FD-172 SS1]
MIPTRLGATPRLLLRALNRNVSTTTECLQRIAALDQGEGGVNAFVSVSASQEEINQPSPSSYSSPLAAYPVAIKDNICTADLPTTCSSSMLRDFRPPYDATVVRLLKAAGADIIGKTNCDEFGMGSLNTHTVHGPVINPFQPESRRSMAWRERERRSAGGSSGGSAAAVASSMCYAALATDTGGSTRLPAAYSGIAGLKPSYGLISRWGVVSFADSLDCVGIMAKKVDHVRKVFAEIASYDERDPTSAPEKVRNHAQALCRTRMEELGIEADRLSTMKGLRIGIPQEYFPSELSPALLSNFRDTIKKLRDNFGAKLVPISLPSTPYALSAYYVIASAEASSNLARYDGVRYGSRVSPDETTDTTRTSNVYALTRSSHFGPEVRKRILLGTYALSADAFDNYFLQAQRVRALIRADFDNVFLTQNVLAAPSMPLSDSLDSRVDVIMHPSAIRTAPPLSETPDSGLDSYVQDVLTVPASLAGLPALSVPTGYDESGDGWPVGVSVVGQWGCEDMVFAVGAAIEAQSRNDIEP